jgi:hypothetical protein
VRGKLAGAVRRGTDRIGPPLGGTSLAAYPTRRTERRNGLAERPVPCSAPIQLSSGVCNPSVRCGRSGCSTARIGQHRPQIVLIEDDDMVETFSAQGADQSLRDGVRLRRPDGRRDSVDADSLSALSKVVAIDGIPIAEQMAGFLAPGCGLDELPPHPGFRRVGRPVLCSIAPRRRPRSQARGRLAMVLLDNLGIDAPKGSLLLRQLLDELRGQVILVYTPAYDPDANRIESLWRALRRTALMPTLAKRSACCWRMLMPGHTPSLPWKSSAKSAARSATLFTDEELNHAA